MKRAFRITVAVVLTLVLLAIFLRNSEPKQVMQLLRGMNLWWLFAGFASNLGALVCRALRWRTVLRPENPPPFYPTFFATAMGFTSSILLPVRAGDLVRPALLSRRTDIRFTTALGTALVERVLDMVSILTLFVFYILSQSRDDWAAQGVSSVKLSLVRGVASAGLLMLGVMVAFVLAILFFNQHVRRAHIWLGRMLPQRTRDGWLRFFDSFVAAMQLLRSPAAAARILGFTLLIWFFLCSQMYCAFVAIGRGVPFTATFFIGGISILGFSLPTPAGVGGFHKACQTALTSFFGFDVNASVAAALVAHIVGTLPVLVAGLTLLAREGLTVRQLADIGETTDE